MAFQIIKHAFQMIFGNLGQALKASIGPFIILAIIIFGVGLAVDESLASTPGPNGSYTMFPTVGTSGIVAMLILIPAFFFILAWIAVSWHRFILLEEYTEILPAVAGRPIWPYVGRSIIYGFLIGLLAIPLFFIAGLLASPFASMGGSALAFPSILIFVAVAAVLSFVWFRIGLALPAVAVGQPISMGQAWAASGPLSGTIFGVALLLMAINALAELAITPFSLSVPLLGLVLNIVVQWITLMLGVSILTTLYGHLIEKRPLID